MNVDHFATPPADKPVFDGAFLAYFEAMEQGRARRVAAVLGRMTDRERALVREAAVMANARMWPRDAGRVPPDSQVLADTILACLTMDDLYPTMHALEAEQAAYRPYQRCFTPNRPGEDPDDHEHDGISATCDYGWQCNIGDCTFRTDDMPCPTHAPTTVPGMRLVECQAQAPHLLWAHDRDDYGIPCFWCQRDRAEEELTELRDEADQARHRRHAWAQPFARLLYKVGLVKSRGYSWNTGCSGCMTWSWRWSR